MTATPPSLLEQLREPSNEAAWGRFVQLYTPLLLHWAGRLCPQPADAENLVQEVLLTLVLALPRFRYQPGRRFRGWLWTITLNKHRRQDHPVPADPLPDEGPAAEGGPDDLAEAEYRCYLVDRALQLMRTDFEPTTWKACWENVVNGRPAAEVAAELGITPNAVHLAKARVLRRLRHELAGLLD